MAQITILVIEPDARTGREMGSILEGAGYRVLTRPTGSSGLDAVKTERPDLVVVDCEITDLDGIRLTREIRRRCRSGIILLATLDEPAACVEGLDVGADDYLRKPVSMRELAARIAAVLRRIDEERRIWASSGMAWSAVGRIA